MLNLNHPRPWLRAWLALVLVAVVLAAGRPALAGGVVYVVPGGAGTKDGSSWANAKDLATALAAANSGDELWVKAGTYKPDTTGLTDPRKATFTLKTGVAVYGGFAGTETTRAGRNPAANVTTLSGDLLGNDTPNTPATLNDNAYHVVTADSVDATAILDGFTITGGVASDTSRTFFSLRGGGIVSNGADATFRNLIITGNSAEANGGGMVHYFGSPTLTNVTFSGNFADSGSGMYITGDTPHLTNVSFISNGSPVATYGGGLVISNGSSASLTNVTFKLNEAAYGGGLYVTTEGTPTLINASFINNQADYGAGLYSDSLGLVTLYNALFIGNFGSYGAGVASQGSQVNLVNATFNGNSADKGAAVYTDNNTNLTTTVPTLTSSILWGDGAPSTLITPTEIYNARGSASVSYSIVQGGYAGTGNLNADPKFISPVDPNTSNTTNANLRLGAGSAALDVGDPNAAIPPLPAGDLDGKPRIVGRIDMGAYETPDTTSPTVTLNPSGNSCTVPGANGWCRGTQTAGFTASDAGSGVASPCSGASCTFTQSTTTNGSSVSIASGQACDAANNCNPGINAGPFKIDSAAPTASITTPANGANYTVGASVLASYTCGDTGGSGVATCSGTTASGSAIDTATPGAKTFSVSVADNAGNTTNVQVSYTVGYTFVYLSPTVGPPSVNNLYPSGLPPWYTTAKWRLANAAGTPVAAGLVAAVRYTPMTCGAALPAYSDSYPTASGGLVPVPRPEVYQGPWLFNWQLPMTRGCYALYAKYASGQIVPFLYRIN